MNDKALYKISYGVYIVSAASGGRINGQISNTVMQVTAQPPAVAVCINKKNFTHSLIEKSNVFSVSILSKETPLKFIGMFGFNSGRDIDKFKGVSQKTGSAGAPIVLDNSVGYLECEVAHRADAVTHTIFIARVSAAEVTADGEAMTYAYYHEIKKGATPSTAPTYIGGKQTEEKKEGSYVCTVCGYVYDPQRGDPENGIKAGTVFKDLPADWVCPVCGAAKDKFKKQD